MNIQGKRVSLVLGSGGARGLAHIGVIDWLQEHGYEIVSVSGSSIGALVGGIYAMGKLEEFREWVTAINRLEILKLLDFTLGRGGMVKGERIIDTLRALTGDQRIEDLPIAFTAVAADIANEKEVWISSGPVFDAIRASISLPLLFTPVMRNGVSLLDGGILNPVPIAPTFRDHSDITIAVNLSGPPDPELDTARQPVVDNRPARNAYWSRQIDRFIDSLAPDHSEPEGISMYDIAYQAVDAMQGAIARQKLAAYPPDRVLELPRNLCGILEFDRAAEMITHGYQLAAQQSLPSFRT